MTAVGIDVRRHQRHRTCQIALHAGKRMEEFIALAAILADEQVPPGGRLLDGEMKMHRAAGLFLHGFGHEGGMHIVVQGRLPDRAFEQESLVGKLERRAVIEIDFHLRRAGLVAERVDIDLLDIAIVIDVLEQRIELVHRIDAVGLARLFRPARLAGRRDKRRVGIGALLDKEEFQLRRHHGCQPGILEQPQHPLQHRARREGNNRALMVIGVVNDLRRRLGIPWHQPATVRIRAQDDIRADLVQHFGIQIGTGDRLAEHIFGKAQPAGPGSAGEFMHGQNLAAWNAGNIADQAFDLSDRLIFQPAGHVERHLTSPVVADLKPVYSPSWSAVASSACAAIRTVSSISARL